MTLAIKASGLAKAYGDVVALNGIDIEVEQGTVLGLLGPNGSGKTTTVRILATLLQADSGSASVGGFDVATQPDEVRSVIGLTGQYAAVDQNLTGLENLVMVGKLYHLGARVARQRAQELIELFDLVEAQNRTVKGYSGGMRRRIDLAGALVIRPPVLFLDEPTTGLDPRSRLGLWEVIEQLVTDGTTVLLTTQYLEEADRLADSISVIDNGRVIAKGTADELKASVGGLRVAVTVIDEAHIDAARSILTKFGSGETAVLNGRTLVVPVQDGPKSLAAIVSATASGGIGLHDAGMRRPTLDDVFLQLTGHAAESDEAEKESAA